MRRGWWAAWAVGLATLVGGCTAPAIAEPLGSVGYLRDKEPPSAPATWVYTGADDLDALVAIIGAAAEPELSRSLAAVDLDTHVVVSLYFDACAKADPSLVMDGATVSVRYGTTLNRACARAVDTLAVFAVPRDRLPEPWRLQVCDQTLAVTAGVVTGEPIGLC